MAIDRGTKKNRKIDNIASSDSLTTNTKDWVLPLSSQPPLEEDDPCWGTPEKNDLPYLLSLLDKSKSILHESEEYIALDKPPDLRMDGPYKSTVHKLTTYWYPSNTLLKQPNLFKAIEFLHKHNYLPDNNLRSVHQLDSATSGLLLVARTRQAAAAATKSFEQRTVDKVYLAIVHGHVSFQTSLNNSDDAFPVLSPTRLSTIDDSEYKYKKSKAPKTERVGDTFRGFLPVPSAFVKWQALMKQKARETDQCKKNDESKVLDRIKRQRKEKKQKNGTVLETHEFEKLVNSCVVLSLEHQKILLSSKWTDVRSNTKWKQTFQQLANQYNATLKEKNDEIYYVEPLPRLFRVQGEENEEAFYIHAACAQVKDQFRMKLHPDAMPFDTTLLPSDTENLDFKPALTRCVVLQKGYLSGKPVTKVRLQPRTGRRHQLRLHMVVAGHPIVGDLSYEGNDTPKNICPRLCLHAHRLSLNLIGGEKSSFVAPDPFIVISNENESVAGKTVFGALVPGDKIK